MESIAVYCGASRGRNRAYLKAAKELGHELASRNITLIYGGGSIGLMGRWPTPSSNGVDERWG